MWFIERIREGVESLPLEISRTLGMREELSAKASLSAKLHCNVLTPEKIPEFFIPPRLTRGAPPTLQDPCLPHAGGDAALRDPPRPHIEIENVGGARQGGGRGEGAGSGKGVLCGAHYGLAGLYESPNTRRKESLFLAQFKGRSLERAGFRNAGRAPGVPPPAKALTEQGSTESDTPSSSDSSPHGSPVLTRSISSSALLRLFGAERPASHLTRSASKLSLGGGDYGWPQEECVSVESAESAGETAQSLGSPALPISLAPPTSTTTPPTSLASPTSLAPPIIFPLDLLHCQERLQREHVLPLEGRGRVRLTAERDHAGASLRVRVVSVEDLHDGAPGGRLVHCCVSLCLTPGKWQRQNSATIRNCRNPVFNEDFFFTELGEDGFHSMALRLKVLDKASTLKRAVVLGVTSKPLSQLLPL
ncbi:C2 calcium-dependent domain-containing protein 4C [Anguilla anguilla]|uniref:C2 calcium-dependent domain-containing protein 4C n=1 Tax=Anguilla anguilla TaxID=7936 RepID=UPI0015AC5F9F|nr:C2 calcium-dependent domain-containing protein 4C [Anguilla anguilla]